MRVRRATAGEAVAIVALTRAAYAPWVAVIGREPLPMTFDYADLLPSHLVDVADEGGLVALIDMVPDVDHLLIENVAVHPDHQGRGVGRRLMDHAERVAAGLGLAEIRLYTNAAFGRNLAFYQSLGYVETDRRPFRGGFTVYFAKRLNAGDPSFG